MAKFGQQFRAARKKAGRTMGDVAREFGCAVSYVSDVELGRRKPFKTDNIVNAARFFECDPRPLVEAAARERGAVEIEDPRLRSVAAGLARSADRLSTEDIQAIEEILSRAEKST